MKNLLLLFADILISKNQPHRWVLVYVMRKFRNLSLVLTGIVLSLIFAGSALGMILTDLQRTTELQQGLAVSQVSYVGSVILFLALTSTYLLFRKSFWGLSTAKLALPEEIPAEKRPVLHPELSPMVNAVTLLILDHVEERKQKRAAPKNASESVFSQSPDPRNSIHVDA